ncbi:ribonuclease HII [Kordiimonas sp. SCSIO 12610]|nr:ribonuclease HII [Kordiimonas sp. SCSIO 12610]
MDLFSANGADLTKGPDWSLEAKLIKEVEGLVCGVDEVGRGPLAGPVVAAAVVLDPNNIPDGLNDSKKLNEKKRFALDEAIRASATAYAIAEVSVEEIDKINILQASLLAMRNAVKNLPVKVNGALVDGNQNPALDLPTDLIIKGDGRSLSIAAASILAKNFRDKLMTKLGERHPEYGWASNAGYGVPKHMAALKLVGVTKYHRKSFAPIRKILDEKN